MPPEDHANADGDSTDALSSRDPKSDLIQRFTIEVLAGPDAGKRFSSAGTPVTIGTHDSATLVLSDTTVSRFHCDISPGERAVIRDLGSRNGTLVDGVSIMQAPLRSGAIVALGRTQLRFDSGMEREKTAISTRKSFGRAVGGSLAMRRLFTLLERVAPGEATILLEGETGTGKEVIAESIHRESPRSGGPFVVVDCGAIPRDLLETELFGHERGAFTGAVKARTGAFEAASGGTLFLDEIGELSSDLQPKLLRALEGREVRRVGSNDFVPIDVRVVAATNRNLRAEVNATRFRSDLYYRLAVVELRLPPLRERMEDLPLLIAAVVNKLGALSPEAQAVIASPEFLSEVRRHSWPGNVRELRNYVERCIALHESAPIMVAEGEPPRVDPAIPLKTAREGWVRHFERQYLEALLREHDDNVSAAARAAEIDRIHLYRLLWRHKLR